MELASGEWGIDVFGCQVAVGMEREWQGGFLDGAGLAVLEAGIANLELSIAAHPD
jgi:hypothetical protein